MSKPEPFTVPRKDGRLRVEVSTEGKWEASYAISRESMDKVYKYMELLQLDEEEGNEEAWGISRDIAERLVQLS